MDKINDHLGGVCLICPMTNIDCYKYWLWPILILCKNFWEVFSYFMYTYGLVVPYESTNILSISVMI